MGRVGYFRRTKNRLVLSVFVREVRFMEEFTDYTKTNQIFLDGYICKEPVYRKTPLGREIADLLVAVNRPYGKSDYIPCIAWAMGIPKDNIVIMSSGDVVELGQESWGIVDHVQSGGILVDGLGVGDVGNIVLRDRQNLAQNGIIIVVLTLEKYSNQLLAGPDIVSRGFVYVRESEDLMEDARAVVNDAVQDCLDRHVNDYDPLRLQQLEFVQIFG